MCIWNISSWYFASSPRFKSPWFNIIIQAIYGEPFSSHLRFIFMNNVILKVKDTIIKGSQNVKNMASRSISQQAGLVLSERQYHNARLFGKRLQFAGS